MRLACLVVPLFPLAARLRAEPELVGDAVAVCAGNGPAARVVAATRVARRAGIRPGQTLAQARALLPKLLARPLDPLCERTAQEALLEVAESISPRIEDAEPGVVYLDLAGLERRHRSRRPATGTTAIGGTGNTDEPDPERAIGQALVDASARIALPAGVGIATSKLAARLAATLPASPRIVPVGEETAFLAPLPLSRLAPELALAQTLAAWGILTIGDLARLPAAEVHARLGASGAALLGAARGLDPRPLTPRTPHLALHEGLTLEWPLLTLEPFLFVARAALDRLLARLAARGFGCLRLELELRLEPDGFDTRAITLPAPTRETKTLLTLVHLDLDARPPGAPVIGFTFTAHPGAPAAAQLALFGPTALSPDRLATTLARLFALLGPGRVGSPREADSHRPEATRLVPFLPPAPPLTSPPTTSARGLMAIRVLRPPLPLEVIVDDGTTTALQRPRSLRSLRAASGDPGSYVAEPSTPDYQASERRSRPVDSRRGETGQRNPQIEGLVRVASGPWLLEEGWWSGTPVVREYWDLEIADGALVRVFRDCQSGAWYADGAYD
jgi:protein ImuB